MIELVAHLRRRALVALGVAVLAPLLSALSLPVPGRVPLALAFFLLVPGVAFAELLRLPSDLATWCVAISVSLAANILAAQAALVFGFWHPLGGHVVVALLSLALLALVLRRDRGGQDDPTAGEAPDSTDSTEPAESEESEESMEAADADTDDLTGTATT